ncbi:hypothetical protein ABW20_dc0110150 [Dactylellina cionopaga]|nr:hypothetical protein ABW20_dc0110150 [Dactylellina cionopaga]
MSYQEATLVLNPAKECLKDDTIIDVFIQEICPLLYKRIYDIWVAVGSENPTFKDANGVPIFSERATNNFRHKIVHLPYLIRTYGTTHFATLHALTEFISLLTEYDINDDEFINTPRLQCSFLISSYFGRATYEDAQKAALELIEYGAFEAAYDLATKHIKKQPVESRGYNGWIVGWASFFTFLCGAVAETESVDGIYFLPAAKQMRNHFVSQVQRLRPNELENFLLVAKLHELMAAQVQQSEHKKVLETSKLTDAMGTTMAQISQILKPGDKAIIGIL